MKPALGTDCWCIMDAWTVTKDGWFKRNQKPDLRISFISSEKKMGHVIVHTSNGERSLVRIADYKPDGGTHMASSCKTSRSLFLQWIKDNTNVNVSFDQQRPGPSSSTYTRQININDRSSSASNRAIIMEDLRLDQMPGTNKNDVHDVHSNDIVSITTDWDDVTNDIRNAFNENDGTCDDMFAMETVNEDHTTVHELPNTKIKTPMPSDLLLECKSKILGKSVRVPIENLFPPSTNRRVRDLDQTHVNELQVQFQRNGGLTTIFLGFVEKGTTLENILEPGRGKIEVIGGNHTRQALSNLRRNRNVCHITHVYMDIYEALTDEEALMLGLQHNEQHRHSKETSFEEIVFLIRKLRHSIKYGVESWSGVLEWRLESDLGAEFWS